MVASRLGAGGDASWYAAATLVKLQRPEDALEAFAPRSAPLPRPPTRCSTTTGRWRATTRGCSSARTPCWTKSAIDRPAHRRPGAEDARGHRRAPDLRASVDSIDWYHSRGEGAAQGRPHALAALYYREASALAARRPDRHRQAEARASLSGLRKELAP